MEILDEINRKSADGGLAFLVIGGLAINSHGCQRQTADVDLLGRNGQREDWKAMMALLGHKIFHAQGAFIQFSPVEGTGWPVDIMFVNEETFGKMSTDAVEVKIAKTSARIPSAEHLIALKIHALKYTNSRRRLKDLLDIVSLIEAKKLDVNGDEIKGLCEKYGNKKIHAQIIALAAK